MEVNTVHRRCSRRINAFYLIFSINYDTLSETSDVSILQAWKKIPKPCLVFFLPFTQFIIIMKFQKIFTRLQKISK